MQSWRSIYIGFHPNWLPELLSAEKGQYCFSELVKPGLAWAEQHSTGTDGSHVVSNHKQTPSTSTISSCSRGQWQCEDKDFTGEWTYRWVNIQLEWKIQWKYFPFIILLLFMFNLHLRIFERKGKREREQGGGRKEDEKERNINRLLPVLPRPGIEPTT